MPLELKAAVLTTDAAIQKKFFWSGIKTLIFSTEEITDIMKKGKFLKKSDLLVKGVSKAIENEAFENKCGLLSMLLVTLAASLLGSMLTVKGVIWASEGAPGTSPGQVESRAGHHF